MYQRLSQMFKDARDPQQGKLAQEKHTKCPSVVSEMTRLRKTCSQVMPAQGLNDALIQLNYVAHCQAEESRRREPQASQANLSQEFEYRLLHKCKSIPIYRLEFERQREALLSANKPLPSVCTQACAGRAQQCSLKPSSG